MSLVVRHLNCATLCPMMAGERHSLVCHVLLVETAAGLVLVDTGLGTGDLADRKRLGAAFLFATGPALDPAETATAQLTSLGYSPADVRHIVLTHLDLDHAGGLSDFPEARVHVRAEEHEAGVVAPTEFDRRRYRSVQWQHGPRWTPASPSTGGAPWFGFQAVRDLEGLPPEILMIPLTGHTRGHAAVAVQSRTGWLLHAGDAYFASSEIDPEAQCPLPLRVFQRVLAADNEQRLANQARLRELRRDHGGEITVFCAHDRAEYERLAGPR